MDKALEKVFKDLSEVTAHTVATAPRGEMLISAAINRLASAQSPDTFGIDDLIATRADLARLHKAAKQYLKAQNAVTFSGLDGLLTELATKY